MTGIRKIAQAGAQAAKNVGKKEKTQEQKPNSIMVGGIKYNKNDVKNVSTSEAMFDNHNGFRDGLKHEVELRDGTKLDYNSVKYEDGSSNEQTRLEKKAEVQFEKDGTINFKGLYDVEIKDTPKNDNYRLLGCEYTNVKADRIVEESPGAIARFFGAEGEIKSADADKILFSNRILPDGTVQKSHSSWAQVQSGDEVSNIGKTDHGHDYTSTTKVKDEVNKYGGQIIKDYKE